MLLLGHTAQTDHTLVSEVFENVRKCKSLGFAVYLHWSPGHSEIEWNGIGDRLANNALEACSNGNGRQLYGVAHATGKALVRSALRAKPQLLWTAHSSAQEDCHDHISQIRTQVGKCKPLLYGFGRQRRILSRLPLGHVHLNAYLYRFDMRDTPLCNFGAWELREHFLISFPLFDHLRAVAFTAK